MGVNPWGSTKLPGTTLLNVTALGAQAQQALWLVGSWNGAQSGLEFASQLCHLVTGVTPGRLLHLSEPLFPHL
jgi:hypothetical protein